LESLGYVATHHREDVEGEKAAREAVERKWKHSVRRLQGDQTLEGSERSGEDRQEKSKFSWHPTKRTPQRPAFAKAIEGAENP
jgi:hypothetical protein